jgi:hypothetical protein
MRRTALLVVLSLAAGCAPREIKVTMNSDNNSGQKGFAVITDKGKSITVEVETSAPDFEGAQNVHIHKGNCGEVEEVYAPLLNLQKLEDKPGRVGSTSTDVLKKDGSGLVQFDEFEKGEWLINVHDARDNLIYVSCGEFSAK